MIERVLLNVLKPSFADFKRIISNNEHYTLDYLENQFTTLFGPFVGMFELGRTSSVDSASIRRLTQKNQAVFDDYRLKLVGKLNLVNDSLKLGQTVSSPVKEVGILAGSHSDNLPYGFNIGRKGLIFHSYYTTRCFLEIDSKVKLRY